MIWDIIHREMVSQIVSQVQIAAEKNANYDADPPAMTIL